MNSDFSRRVSTGPADRPAPEVVLALDVPGAREALTLVEGLPDADFVKVGLQLFTSAGAEVVKALRGLGRRVFLDLKLHDIPSTVAHAVESAARMEVALLTLHASGGRAMLRAAREVLPRGTGPGLLAVTVLTSLDDRGLAEAWGRTDLDAEEEVVRLARLAEEEGMDGVVASVREITSIRESAPALRVLTPGIRLPGDAAGDQRRVASPAEAARLGADYLVVGRSVTTAADPAAALRLVREAVGR
jgi:orotidine-5'-phosphate decarboxylase